MNTERLPTTERLLAQGLINNLPFDGMLKRVAQLNLNKSYTFGGGGGAGVNP